MAGPSDSQQVEPEAPSTATVKLEEPDCSSANWYFSREDVEKHSPSRNDGIDLKKETYYRRSYCTYLQDLGMRLKVPQVTIATAIVFCHRFFLRQSHARNDRQLIATICMFLAGKVEETPRHLLDVIKVSYAIRFKKDPNAAEKIKQKHILQEQKDLMLVGERLVLATLGFDLNIHHPYKPLVSAIKKFNVAQNTLAQVAWNFVNDGLRTSLCLQFKPHHIAAGAIFLAAKFLKVKLPSDGERAWWQEFEVTPRQLEVVSNQMLELYEQNKPVPGSKSSDPSASAPPKGTNSTQPSSNGELSAHEKPEAPTLEVEVRTEVKTEVKLEVTEVYTVVTSEGNTETEAVPPAAAADVDDVEMTIEENTVELTAHVNGGEQVIDAREVEAPGEKPTLSAEKPTAPAEKPSVSEEVKPSKPEAKPNSSEDVKTAAVEEEGELPPVPDQQQQQENSSAPAPAAAPATAAAAAPGPATAAAAGRSPRSIKRRLTSPLRSSPPKERRLSSPHERRREYARDGRRDSLFDSKPQPQQQQQHYGRHERDHGSYHGHHGYAYQQQQQQQVYSRDAPDWHRSRDPWMERDNKRARYDHK